jgi:hypothetical protein
VAAHQAFLFNALPFASDVLRSKLKSMILLHYARKRPKLQKKLMKMLNLKVWFLHRRQLITAGMKRIFRFINYYDIFLRSSASENTDDSSGEEEQQLHLKRLRFNSTESSNFLEELNDGSNIQKNEEEHQLIETKKYLEKQDVLEEDCSLNGPNVNFHYFKNLNKPIFDKYLEDKFEV